MTQHTPLPTATPTSPTVTPTYSITHRSTATALVEDIITDGHAVKHHTPLTATPPATVPICSKANSITHCTRLPIQSRPHQHRWPCPQSSHTEHHCPQPDRNSKAVRDLADGHAHSNPLHVSYSACTRYAEPKATPQRQWSVLSRARWRARSSAMLWSVLSMAQLSATLTGSHCNDRHTATLPPCIDQDQESQITTQARVAYSIL
jgi:hypothetical protein